MSIIFSIPFPAVTTERISLRQLTTSDEMAIFKLRSDERVNEFLDRPRIQALEEAGKFIEKINAGIEKNEWFYWAVTLKDNPALLVGTICLWNFSGDRLVAEIGYELDPGYQGKGIMQEAINAVIGIAFNQINLKTIKAYTHVDNQSSSKLLEKFSFKIKNNIEPGDGSEAELKNMVIYILNSGNG